MQAMASALCEVSRTDGSNSLQGLRGEVAKVVCSVETLQSHVEALPSHEQHSALQTEIGAVASVVRELSDRVDYLTGKPQQLPMVRTKPFFLNSNANEALEMEKLQSQLAALVGEVQRTTKERSESFRSDPVSAQPFYRRVEDEGQMPKAPSPRRWMSESLADSVARSSGFPPAGV